MSLHHSRVLPTVSQPNSLSTTEDILNPKWGRMQSPLELLGIARSTLVVSGKQDTRAYRSRSYAESLDRHFEHDVRNVAGNLC